ncbi:mucin-5B-like [Homarus americanus]|uniref:mucin-5B-like n=1 Tax=Homarus americanus TaxID=6706 RepID=UPI001C468A71|nr:mucin-5B-like [Homarus americanus]
MGLPLVLLPLLLGALPHTYAALNSCSYKGQTVAHGSVMFSVATKCMQVVCDNGSPAPKSFHGADTCGCCEFGNVIYPPGRVFLAGCVKMTCEKAKWKAVGEVEKRCKLCEVFNDPHFWSFDRQRFDYHGDCTYTLAQNYFSLTPQYGIFAEFKRCYTVPTCVHKTTYQDNPNLSIEIGATGLAAPDIYNILVNGQKTTVTADDYAQKVTVGGVEQDVLVWRQGACVRVLGSKGLVLQQCKNRIDVWAHPKLSGIVHGLCGTPDGNANNEFTTRDQGQLPHQHYAPEEFAQSWLSGKQNDQECTKDGGKKAAALNEEAKKIVNECRGNRVNWTHFADKCTQAVGGAKVNGQGPTQDLTVALSDACRDDLCIISKKTPAPEKATQAWLGEVTNMSAERVFIEQMATVCDPDKGECVDIGPPPKECIGEKCYIDLIFNPGDFDGTYT